MVAVLVGLVLSQSQASLDSLDVFVSNFAEAHLNPIDARTAKPDVLEAFAIRHLGWNRNSANFSSTDVSKIIRRFFDRTVKPSKSKFRNSVGEGAAPRVARVYKVLRKPKGVLEVYSAEFDSAEEAGEPISTVSTAQFVRSVLISAKPSSFENGRYQLISLRLVPSDEWKKNVGNYPPKIVRIKSEGS